MRGKQSRLSIIRLQLVNPADVHVHCLSLSLVINVVMSLMTPDRHRDSSRHNFRLDSDVFQARACHVNNIIIIIITNRLVELRLF